MKRILVFFALSLLPLAAQDSRWNHSLGIGVHDGGLMGTYAGTSPSRFGLFLGLIGVNRKDSDLPPEADFSWVNYNSKDWKGKEAYHAGVAFRASSVLTFGIGYGYQRREMYEAGPSMVTGFVFRRPIPDETKKGLMGMIDFGSPKGIGGQIVGGQYGFGAAIVCRF